MKLTVAIPADISLQRHISTMCTAHAEIDWVPSDACFLPIRNLGIINDRNILEALDLELMRVTPRCLDIAFTGVGIEQRGMVDELFLEVAPTDALMSFRAKIENAIRRSGLKLEKRRYRPRLRIGSVDCSLRAQTILWAQSANLLGPSTMPVDRFSLFQAHGDSFHPAWERCEDYPLTQLRHSNFRFPDQPSGDWAAG